MQGGDHERQRQCEVNKSKSTLSTIEDSPLRCLTPTRLVILINLRLQKVTMPTTIPTILDQISAEKTKVSERLARLDADREKIATQLDLETAEAGPSGHTAPICGHHRGPQLVVIGRRKGRTH